MNIIIKTILILLLCLFSACQLTEKDLNEWYNTEGGEGKLAAYLVESHRSLESRVLALDLLIQKKKYDHLATVFKLLAPSNKDETPSAEREQKKQDLLTLFNKCLEYVQRDLKPKSTRDQQAMAADLAFLVMSYPLGEELFKKDKEILVKLTDWSLGYLRTKQNSPSVIAPKDVLLATALLGEKDVLDVITAQMKEYQGDVEFIVNLQKVLFNMRDPKVDTLLAEAMLQTARKVYPDGITMNLVRAMGENNNETLLKFLIDMSRDRVVNMKVLDEAISMAGSQLKEKGIENFKRILSSERSASHHIFYALQLMWRFGGVEHLADSLKSISPRFSTPVSGAELKLSVEDFCQNDVGKKKDESRAILTSLLDELGGSNDYWPARLYVITCIHLLYPDDFPRVMKEKKRYKRYYLKDKTRIPAWISEQDITLGAIATEYMMPLNR